MALVLVAAVSAGTGLHALPGGLGGGWEEPSAPASAGPVTALLQDKTGFLWIGTRNGLLFYDGYRVVRFQHDASDPTSISGNTVRTLYQDHAGRLWVGTNTGGLDLLDSTTGKFRAYRHDSSDPNSISHDSVNAIVEDRSGRFWVGTQIGLNLFDPNQGTFTRFRFDPGDPGSVCSDYVYALHVDRDGALWAGTVGGGLGRRDPDSGRFTCYRNDPNDSRSLGSDKIFDIVEDKGGSLWLATEVGLDRMDRATGTFQRYRHDPADPSSLPHRLVSSLERGRAGRIWVGTWGGGVSCLDVASGKFRVQRLAGLPSGGRTARVAAMLADRSGTIWVGTWAGGLVRVRSGSALFSTVAVPENGEAEKGADATAVREDARGNLWIGTWGAGLLERLAGKERFRRFVRDQAGRPTLSTVLAVLDDPDGTIWAGTMGGLYHLDPRSGRIQRFEHSPADRGSLGAGYVTSLLRDHSGRLWVGVGGSGLHRMRKDGKTFDRFINDAEDPGSISDNYVTALMEDARGTLWVGTRSGGLNALGDARARFTRYVPDPKDPNSLGHHYVTSLLPDGAGGLWVGTGGGGLNRLVRNRGDGVVQFTRITERDGLVNDNVSGLLRDAGGSLWVSTRGGLSRFHPSDGTFVNYRTGDGLPSPFFNAGSVWAGRASLYFGSARGVVVVPKGTAFQPPAPSPTVLRSIRTLEGPVPSKRPAWELEHLEVPYGEALSLEFAVLDFSDRRPHHYAYRLAGLNDRWADLGWRREVTLTNLRPGRYTLNVRGQNDGGVWSETSTPIEIEVVPPFWLTWWFRGGLALALLALAVGAHRVRTAVLGRRNRELEELQKQREKALREARASEKALHEAYRRLRDLSRRLEGARENERRRIAHELHDEMGQVLTAAKINLQLLQNAGESENRDRRIEDTIALMDRMIENVRALSLDLRPPLLDELGLVPALSGYLETRSRRSGLKIELEADTVPRGLPAEISIVAFRAVQEAVTNVLRHAETSGARVTLRREGGWLDVTVSDDGKGFDVEQVMERAHRGHHLGLLGIRERVESLGGAAAIESSPGKGTTIRVSLPLARNDA